LEYQRRVVIFVVPTENDENYILGLLSRKI